MSILVSRRLQTLLAANRTYYVDASTGSDSNSGLSSGAAFATIAKAMAVLATINANGKTVTVRLADGTYSTNVVLPNVVGIAKPGDLILQGNTGDATAVTITSSSARTIDANGINTPWRVQYLTVTCTNASYEAIIARGSGTILEVGNVIAKNGGTNCVAHFSAQAQALLRFVADCSVDGNANRLLQAADAGMLDGAFRTFTFLSNATFTLTVDVTGTGYFRARGMTFTLGAFSVTGQRYSVATNGVINTLGGGASYFPGSTSGATATGGQYA